MNAVLTPSAVPISAPPIPSRMTPEDLLQMPDRGKGFELTDGELKEIDMSFLSSFLAGRGYFFLQSHVMPLHLGWVSPEGTSFKCFPKSPDKVRRADAAFHRLDRLTLEQVRSEGHCTVVPDLVVEVVSPNDLAYEVDTKRIEWLEAGAQLVWVVYPEKQNIHAFAADGTVRLFSSTDTLTAEPVLPDFRVAVEELFRLPVLS